jgi:hypothetical protein
MAKIQFLIKKRGQLKNDHTQQHPRSRKRSAADLILSFSINGAIAKVHFESKIQGPLLIDLFLPVLHI